MLNTILSKVRFLFTFVISISLFCAIILPLAEKNDPYSNIHSLGDGLWWALSTITSVGYGDHFPVTIVGRFIGAFLIMFGLSGFYLLMSMIAGLFVVDAERKYIDKVMHRLDGLEKKLEKLTDKITSYEKHQKEILEEVK